MDTILDTCYKTHKAVSQLSQEVYDGDHSPTGDLGGVPTGMRLAGQAVGKWKNHLATEESDPHCQTPPQVAQRNR